MARRLAVDATEAEDLVGQTLLNASGAWADFDGRHARSWLLTIMRNVHLRSTRKRVGEPRFAEIDVEAVGEAPWNAIDWGLVGPLLLAELDRLPEEYRLAVALCDVEEISYQEASEVLNVSIGTLKSRLFRGRRLLRERLAGFAREVGR